MSVVFDTCVALGAYVLFSGTLAIVVFVVFAVIEVFALVELWADDEAPANGVM